MNEQRSIFDKPIVPWVKNSDTSFEAAAAQTEESVNRREKQILDALREHGDLARFEIEEVTNLKGNTVGPRVRGLLDRGLIVETGVTRKTPSGRDAEVLRIK